MTTNRPLRVFLCHSSADKPAVRELYQKLRAEPWISPWLDEEDIFPGDDWNLEIQKAIRETDAIIACLSKGSITKEGYVQREIKTALDYADEKPQGTVYIIPIRLEECKPPERLSKWQYADYFEGNRERAFERLLVSLQRRATSLGIRFKGFFQKQKEKNPREKILVDGNVKKNQKKETEEYQNKIVTEILLSQENSVLVETSNPVSSLGFSNRMSISNGMEFLRVPAGDFYMGSNNGDKDERPAHVVTISYDYWIARFCVTNELYNIYLLEKGEMHPVNNWDSKKDHPVVYISWGEAMSYCEWLNRLCKNDFPENLLLRLPTEAEWEKAARGSGGYEFPWGNIFDKNKCNSLEGSKGDTTPVGLYSPEGDSFYGCADMAGNVFEWTHSLKKDYPYNILDGREDNKALGLRVLRGGSFNYNKTSAYSTYRNSGLNLRLNYIGFRLSLAPPLPK
jgi:formylglycine-generating enzyme required for sulfatase activity